MVTIFFIYGLAFFVLGVSILIYPRKDSTFMLSRTLWLLGLYGIIHGINEWIDMFILLYRQYAFALHFIGIFFLSLSFLLLVKFGVRNIVSIKKSSLALGYLPWVLFILWLLLVYFGPNGFLYPEIWARYLLGTSGMILTAYALILQAGIFKKERLAWVALNLKAAASAFLFYGFFGGIIVPKAGFFPASVFNFDSFRSITGIPVQAFRALCAVVITYNMLKVLAVFNWEARKNNEELKREIKERQRIEEELKLSEARFSALFNQASDCILLLLPTDDGLIISAINEIGCKMHGYTCEELLGKPISLLDDAQAKALLPQRAERLMSGEHLVFEINHLKKDGSIFPVEVSAQRVKIGEKFYILAIDRDISERKKAEEILRRDKEAFEKMVQQSSQQLIEAERELDKASRLADMGMFAASVAHELRNPLAAIQIAVYNIKKKDTSVLLEKHLSNIEKKVAESDQIINNLLFYARLKIAHHERISIYDLLNECIDMAEKRFEGKNVVISRNFDSISGLVIDADPLQMRELFNNIFNNAFDAIAGKEGKIKIRAEQADAGHVAIYIKDNGIGIDEENLSKIYDPFFTTKSNGTGLGLTVASQIVYLHDGAMNIQSKKGEWAEVTVVLPVKKKEK